MVILTYSLQTRLCRPIFQKMPAKIHWGRTSNSACIRTWALSESLVHFNIAWPTRNHHQQIFFAATFRVHESISSDAGSISPSHVRARSDSATVTSHVWCVFAWLTETTFEHESAKRQLQERGCIGVRAGEAMTRFLSRGKWWRVYFDKVVWVDLRCNIV